ncbi:hypothetical protein [Pedobacter sp. SL55]|uniref:hypothetical protein n=1 Tax=Pedobacter sp. SL55 TaxID=2995161 RepID=UPI00226F6CA3|nr:hypothetical protein [Pedobacter sp. SL55]WAC41208.1 hypothetical protein OVA16_02195 [Pedobacter sp. SL55]
MDFVKRTILILILKNFTTHSGLSISSVSAAVLVLLLEIVVTSKCWRQRGANKNIEGKISEIIKNFDQSKDLNIYDGITANGKPHSGLSISSARISAAMLVLLLEITTSKCWRQKGVILNDPINNP